MGGHQVGRPEPHDQRQLGAVHDGPGLDRGLAATAAAFVGPTLGLEAPGVVVAAAGTAKAIGPTDGGKIGGAGCVVRNLIACKVYTANIQDRDGAPGVFARLRREAPKLRHMFADGGYAGPKLRGALVSLGRWTLQIVKRPDTAEGFEVLPRRWVVERTFAWLGRCAGWQRIGKNPSRAPRLGSLSPISGASQGFSQRHEKPQIVLNQTLRPGPS